MRVLPGGKRVEREIAYNGAALAAHFPDQAKPASAKTSTAGRSNVETSPVTHRFVRAIRPGESRDVKFVLGHDDVPGAKAEVSAGGGQPLTGAAFVQGSL
jgi:hypothetical protein